MLLHRRNTAARYNISLRYEPGSEVEPPMSIDNDAESLSRPLYTLSPPWHVALASLLGGPLGGSAVLVMNYARRDQMLPALLTATAGFWATIATGLAVYLAPQWTTYLAAALLVPLTFTLLAGIVEGRAYRRHVRHGGATVPLRDAALIGAGATLGVVVAFFGAREFLPDPKVQFGAGAEIYYLGQATEAEAERLGRYLEKLGGFKDRAVTMRLTRQGNSWTLGVVVKPNAWEDEQVVASFASLRRLIAMDVFPGEPVRLEMLDDHLKLRKVVE